MDAVEVEFCLKIWIVVAAFAVANAELENRRLAQASLPSRNSFR